MAESRTFVVVGGGLAGARAVDALRSQSFDGRIILLCDEVHLPYDRPPLSKDFLAEKQSSLAHAYEEAGRRLALTDFTMHDAAWYRERDIDLRLGTPAVSLDRSAHRIGLADGATLGYDKLLLATGSRSRRPPIPGSDAGGVHYLRTFDDASALEAALTEGASLGVVGGGWIGLEVAASARSRGVAVTVVEAARLPLLAALGAENAEVFAALHREHGVNLRLGSQVARISTAAGRATGLVLGDGSIVAVDAVLVAVGAKPNIELAERADLATADGGVPVDASLRSRDPDIYAVGDIAAAEHPLLGTRIRTEHWANARKQPAVAASGMLGKSAEYTDLPYFFTDQYELGMEYVGYAPSYERIVFRGDVDSREYIAFWLDAGNRVLAGMNVNISGVIGDIKDIVRGRAPVDPDRLADPDCPLTSLLTGR